MRNYANCPSNLFTRPILASGEAGEGARCGHRPKTRMAVFVRQGAEISVPPARARGAPGGRGAAWQLPSCHPVESRLFGAIPRLAIPVDHNPRLDNVLRYRV